MHAFLEHLLTTIQKHKEFYHEKCNTKPEEEEEENTYYHYQYQNMMLMIVATPNKDPLVQSPKMDQKASATSQAKHHLPARRVIILPALMMIL